MRKKPKRITYREAVLSAIKNHGGRIESPSCIYLDVVDMKKNPYEPEIVVKHNIRCILYDEKKRGVLNNPERGVWEIVDKN